MSAVYERPLLNTNLGFGDISNDSGSLDSRSIVWNTQESSSTLTIFLTATMFILGIVLWAVGASQGNPGMALAGKILFGLSIAPLAISLVAACCLSFFCGCLEGLAIQNKVNEKLKLNHRQL